MGRRIGKLAQDLEDRADTSRHLPLAVIGWTLSIILCELNRLLPGKHED